MVIPFLFSLGRIAYYNFDYLYDYPISGPLRDMFIRYDFIFSLLVYIYAFLTRATIKKQYRFFNFFHYLLATLIIYLLFTSMIIFVNNGPIVATFVNWPTYHFRKGVSLGVPVYFVWQLVFNRARKVSLTWTAVTFYSLVEICKNYKDGYLKYNVY